MATVNYEMGEQPGIIPPMSIADAEGRTDLCNAERLIHKHGQNLRYCGPWSKWLAWDGKRWHLDDVRAVDGYAKDIACNLFTELGKLKEVEKIHFAFCKASSSRSGIDNMIALARSEVAIRHDVLNGHPWLFNCHNGTVELETGKLRPHQRGDMLTQISSTAFDPKATCPRWETFLDRIMEGDVELIDYLQRLVGSALTGAVREHVLPIFHGNGANGKSTFVNVVQGMLGPDYSMKAPHNMLMLRNSDAHPTETADLFGRRLVAAVETEAGHRINEPLIKELTGNDRIRARRMREDFWEFSPTHKLWLATNHKPVIRGNDEGIWRRLKLVPFEVSIPPHEQDSQLTDKLVGELSGILNWALAGCQRWRKFGLEDPPQVIAATSEYRGESDHIALFLAEETIEGYELSVKAGALHKAYCDWGGKLNNTAFGRELTARGFERKKRSTGMFYIGIGLQSA